MLRHDIRKYTTSKNNLYLFDVRVKIVVTTNRKEIKMLNRSTKLVGNLYAKSLKRGLVVGKPTGAVSSGITSKYNVVDQVHIFD